MVSAVAVLGLLSLPTSGVEATGSRPAAHSSSCRTGVLTSAPSPGTHVGFFGISALAANDVWAVGQTGLGIGVVAHPLIEHWNGTAWSVAASPRPMPSMILKAVKAISPDNVWAVGLRSQTQVSQEFPVIEHWNGTAWSVVASPGVEGLLNAIAVASPDDIWAVGLRQSGIGGIPSKTLAEHWNGHTWSVVATPSPGTYSDVLSGVTVAGPGDVWAVGETGVTWSNTAPLSEHWDGHSFSVVKMPAGGSFDSGVDSVTSAGPDQVWASGWFEAPGSGAKQALNMTLHWNGRRWHYNFPITLTGWDTLTGITAVSATDIWVVGETAENRTDMEHWNGRVWTALVPGLAQKGNVNTLWSVSASSPTNIWAAGGAYHTLIEHICSVNG